MGNLFSYRKKFRGIYTKPHIPKKLYMESRLRPNSRQNGQDRRLERNLDGEEFLVMHNAGDGPGQDQGKTGGLREEGL